MKRRKKGGCGAGGAKDKIEMNGKPEGETIAGKKERRIFRKGGANVSVTMKRRESRFKGGKKKSVKTQ